jgi:hypothetical protein
MSISSGCAEGGGGSFTEEECYACGGESVCHYSYWDVGGCHQECEPQFAAALREAIRTENSNYLVALLATDKGVHYDVAFNVLRVTRQCGQGVFPLTARIAKELKSAQPLRAAAVLTDEQW